MEAGKVGVPGVELENFSGSCSCLIGQERSTGVDYRRPSGWVPM